MRKAAQPCGILSQRLDGPPLKAARLANGDGRKTELSVTLQEKVESRPQLISESGPERKVACSSSEASSQKVDSELKFEALQAARIEDGDRQVKFESAQVLPPFPGLSESEVQDLLQWVKVPQIGLAVGGTFLLPCKTPIEGDLEERGKAAGIICEDNEFRRADLLAVCAAAGTPIGMVLDLTSGHRYYPGFYESDGVEYLKIPPAKRYSKESIVRICDALHTYLARRRSPDLHVAVHCTHGVNRTGLILAAYLLLRTSEFAHETHMSAIEAFQAARGCCMSNASHIQALAYLARSRLPRQENGLPGRPQLARSRFARKENGLPGQPQKGPPGRPHKRKKACEPVLLDM